MDTNSFREDRSASTVDHGYSLTTMWTHHHVYSFIFYIPIWSLIFNQNQAFCSRSCLTALEKNQITVRQNPEQKACMGLRLQHFVKAVVVM